MRSVRVAVLVVALSATGAAVAEEFQLPPEVTPALRAACEQDVRRVCMGKNATYAKVKSCVIANYMNFGRRCKMQIALAGLGR